MLGVDDETDGEAQVEGFNQNAKKVRDAHAQMAKKVDEKTGTTTTERRNANILRMVNRSICDECKKMAVGDWENVTFFNDVSRKRNVHALPQGRFDGLTAGGVKAKYNDPNVQNRYSDRTLLGEDFMLDDANVTCTSTYKMTVN